MPSTRSLELLMASTCYSEPKYAESLIVDWIAMHALWYDTSILSKKYLLHSNTLNPLKQFVTSYVTSFFASFCFLLAYYDFSSFLEHNSFSSAEQFCDKVSLTIVRFDLFSFVDQLCNKVLLAMLCFDLLSFVEQLSNKVSLTMLCFNSSLFVEQLCDNFSFMILRFNSSSFVEQLCDNFSFTILCFD